MKALCIIVTLMFATASAAHCIACNSRAALSAGTLAAPAPAGAEESPPATRILLLTKSSGFEHSVIKHDDSGTSLVDRVMTEVAQGMGATITCTKDASLIQAESLKNYDVVVFYTSGDLRQVGTDGHPPMPPEGPDALLDWIRAGGGFVGFHAATDTFASGGGPPTPYIEMIGGEFQTHGEQFRATVVPVAAHPAIAALAEPWALIEEWYLFRHMNREDIHVLAMLQIGRERARQPMYDIPDYPIIWCRAFGDGRVLYNGLGHRENVWEHPRFKALIADHIRWARGDGPLQAEPNYAAVVPDAVETP